MKKTCVIRKKKTIKIWLFIQVFISIVFLLSSCSKSEKEVKPEGEKVKLIIQTAGILPPQVKSKKAIKATLNESGNENKIVSSQSIKQNDFVLDIISQQEDMTLTLGKRLSTTSEQADEILKKAAISRVAENVNMSAGIKYRFLLYNKATNTRSVSILVTAGQALEIDVVKGEQFYWYAYSYNTEDDIADPNANNPVLTTVINKPLLYATGEISPVLGTNPIAILFEHKLTQLKVNVNSRNYYADMTELKGKFIQNYVQTATFHIRTGTKTDLNPVNVGELNFINEDEGSIRAKEAQYYTADDNLTAYSVQITDLSIQHPNKSVESLTSKLVNGGIVTFDNFTASNAGNILQGNLRLWLVLPTKSILHFGPMGSQGYEAGTGTTSGYFLKSSYNYGITSDYCKINGFTNNDVTNRSGALASNLAVPANYPDIIICGIFSTINDDDYTALEKYIKRGGVVFLMTETSTTNLRNFLRSIFDNPLISLNTHDRSGAVYKLKAADADVTNGSFGDVRGKYWGQDRSATLYVNNMREADMVVYTESSQNNAPQTGVSMFRHKNLNLIFVGDTGFLANTNGAAGGTRVSNTGYPFATVGGNGLDKYFPTSKAFGRGSASGSPQTGAAGSWQVSNAVIFANALAWMLERAHFSPVDRISP